MAASISTIKNWFKTGMFPTQAQFWAWIDAFRHKDEKVPVTDIEGLNELFTPVNSHFDDPNAHADLFAKIPEINTIIINNGFTKVDDLFTGLADTLWNINGVRYTNSSNQAITIPLCATGMVRTDRVILDTNNNFVIIPGVEVAENPVAEAKPANTLDYTLIPVSDSEVGAPTPPVLGSLYVRKDFDRAQIYTGSGANVVIPLNYLGYSNIYLEGTITSVDGFNFSELAANPSGSEYPHEGKLIRIYNRTSGPVTLNHEMPNNLMFQLSDAANITIPVGESIELVNNSYSLADVDKSWVGIDSVIELPEVLDLKADLVAGKVPAEQLPSYVDDVLEFENFAAFPITGEASKIYLALDTNLSYRWSGSTYVDLNSSKLDKVSTVDVEKVYVKNADGTQGMKPVIELGERSEFWIIIPTAYVNCNVLNEWKGASPENHNYLGSNSYSAFGNGSTPAFPFGAYVPMLNIPPTYLVDEIWVQLTGKPNDSLSSTLEFFVRREDTAGVTQINGGSNPVTISQDTLSTTTGSAQNIRRYEKLAINTHTLPTNPFSYLQFSVRETQNAQDFYIGLAIKLKKP